MNATKKKTAAPLNATEILNTALQMADEENNWYDFSLADLAHRCDTPINEIRHHYADSNAIANAWFQQALEQMLSPVTENVSKLPAKTRLEYFIWRWFEALSPYHRVTTQMLGSKLHLTHIHHWLPMVFDLSRLVQLWRDAAGLRAGGRRRQIEEIALSAIFLATLRSWCHDESPKQAEAHAKLLGMLEKADRQTQFWFSD